MWFWKEGHRVELSVSSHHFKVHTINSLYHCWCWLWLRSSRLCLSGLCTIQLIFFFLFSFPYCILWKKITIYSLTYTEKAMLQGLNIYTNYLEFFVRHLSIPTFIYAIISSYSCGFMNIWFILWAMIQFIILLTFFLL